jgi:hypothetical protein
LHIFDLSFCCAAAYAAAAIVSCSDDSSTLTKGSTLRHLHQEHLQHLLRQAQPAGPHTAQQQQQQEKEDSQEVQQPLHHNVLLLGVGRAVVGRVELARQQQGVAVELVQRVWQVPPLNGELLTCNTPEPRLASYAVVPFWG